MDNLLFYIVTEIEKRNQVTAKALKKNLERVDDAYLNRANSFFAKYHRYLRSIGKGFDYSIDCYFHLVADMFEERVMFLETGRYSSTSFIEVNKRVYANPEIMNYHMHGLILAQFLWPDQYKRIDFFANNLPSYRESVHHYLEIGGGHGLYIDTAVNILQDETSFDLVDISLSSLNIAKGILDNPKINYIHKDIFDFEEDKKYDFITMGEVLEHLEEPCKMLKKIYHLLADDGTFYMTTPANAPMIDHIHLFNNEDEIKEMITDAGFIIKDEIAIYSKTMPLEIARELRIPLMYAAFLTKKV